MYYKAFYIKETHFKTIMKSEIFNIDEDIVIVIHKSEVNKFALLINFVHSDFLSKYIPSMNCLQENWELNSWNFRSIGEFSYSVWIRILFKGAIILKKSENLIKAQSVISPTLLYIGNSNLIEEIEYRKWSNKMCWCRPTTIMYSVFEKEFLESDAENISTFRTVKWVHIYGQAEEFNQKEFTDVLYPFLSKNKRLSIKFIKFKFKYSKETAIKFELCQKSLVFVTPTSVFSIKIDPAKIEIDGLILSVINVNQKKYAVIKWCKLCSENLSVQYDWNNEFLKYFKIKDSSSISNKKDSTFIIANINDIKSIELHYPYSFKINTEFINRNMQVTLNCRKYGVLDLVQNIMQIPRNWNLKINDYFDIDYWFLDQSQNDFWKVIWEFKNVIFKCKNKKDIAINGTIGAFNYEDLNKNIFKINIDGKDEISSYRLLSTLIWE